MRKEMGKIVKSMWFNLGQHKIRFVPEMVGPFLEMTLIPETELRKDTIPIFFDMMQCEYYSSRFRSDDAGHVMDTKRDPSSTRSNFREFEKEMIEKLDTMIEGGAGDEHYKALFREIMMTPCESHTALRDSGIKLINLVTKLLELLLEYRTITQEESKENQMSCIVNLLDFYQSKNYDNLYIKYLRRLCKLHEVCENWAEAGFTLLQYSETLRWSNEPLKTYWNKRKKYRTHRELKEQLYREVLAHFVRGKMWEQAIEISKELVVQYEEETFEYAKLTELHQKMASFYQSIMTDLRLDPEYFRVAFYGRGFPAFLQNKIFVYRGKGFEKLPEFKARILDQFPNAEVMKTLGAPTEEEKQNPVQLLQINKVDAVMGETKFVGKFVQKQILDYYKFNNVNRFIFSRPFNKGKDKENEFASLWIERTVMQTKSTFPGILQWFALSQDEEIYELCPLENAVETMQRANEELRSLILEHQDQNPPLNPLSMKLNGIIDAAVMGGTAKYEQAFFTDQYIEEHPEHAEKIQVLKNLIAEQVPLLENGIKIHQYKKTEDLKPLHDRLETMFDTMRSQVEEKYGRRSCDITVTRGGIGNDGRGHLRKGSSQMMEVRGSRQHQPMPNGDHRLSAFSHGGEVRASLNSQTSIDSTSKPRMLSAFGIGISRKKSNASRGDDPSRSSLTRSSHSSSVILENGFDDLQASPSSSSGNHHPSSSSPLTPSVYVTQNPTCRLLAPSIPSPSHSRSPSITSNRESVGDVDPPPPVLPPKHHLHHRVTLTSDSENMSLSSFDATDNGEAPNDRGEELIPAKQIFINVKKKPPPPPPPGLGSATPPTPPKKPPFKPPE